MQRIHPQPRDPASESKMRARRPLPPGVPRSRQLGYLQNLAQRLAVVLACAIAAAIEVPAQAGGLDPTFGTGGKVTTGVIGSAPSLGSVGLAVQNDGKVVVAGYTYIGVTGGDFTLTRYNANGSLDAGFGSSGQVTTDIDLLGEGGFAVAIQADGKIVAAGFVNDPVLRYDFALVRYDPDGSLDASFGNGGKVTTDFGGSGDSAQAVAIQADGKIIAAGYSATTVYDFALVRYNPDGSLDTSFGTGGLVTTDFGIYDEVRALAIQSDGRIVAAGVTLTNTRRNDFALARYNTDGSLDSSFGTGGKVTTNNDSDIVNSVVIQGDGRIVVAGTTGTSAGSDFALARYDATGLLDPSFGTNGMVITDLGSQEDQGNALAIQGDGKLVVSGFTHTSTSGYDFALARYGTNGAIDTNFGSGGKITTSFATANDQSFGIGILGDGRIVAAGNAGAGDFALARYDTSGALDTSFDTDGRVTTQIEGPQHNAARDIVAVQGDGRIVVAGWTHNFTTQADFALARYNADGSLDSSFGSGGSVVTDLAGNSYEQAFAVTLQFDGKVIAAGWIYNIGDDFALARYNTDGSLDTSFGSGGKVTTDFAHSNVHDVAWAVAVQTDGKIVAAGNSASNAGDYDFAMARYNTDGSLDTGFGSGGLVTTRFGSGTDRANAVAIQGDGKIVVAGYSFSSTTANDFAVARYNTNGSLDTSFGNGGMVTTAFAPNTYEDQAHALGIQGDGKIVVAGYTETPTSTDFALVRYNSDGSLDASFGSGGTLITDVAGFNDLAFAVAIQGDGRIVAAGHSFTPAYGNDFALVRYNPDGTMDAGFGSNGVVTTDFDSAQDRAYAIALQTGKFVLAGETRTTAGGLEYALARYLGYEDPVALLEDLALDVEGLADAKVLNHGQARALEAKLEAALMNVDRGNHAAAINQLQAFLLQVNVLVGASVLSQAQGQALYDQAALILSLLG